MQQLSLKNGKNLIIGLKMKEIREKLKMSQDDLSKILGISKSLISRIELGSIDSLQHATIIKLAEELNINLSWLLFDEGEMIGGIVDVKELQSKIIAMESLLNEKDDEIHRLKNQVDILIKAVGMTK